MTKTKKILCQDGFCINAYGFRVGQNVFAKVDLFDENEGLIKAGEILRIVAIAPKVRLTNPWLIKTKPEYNDNKEYFVNLVRANQKNDFSNRISSFPIFPTK
ncbi:MAG: hypothetical protein AABY22_03970 [Nanoarchaeota archaeon]